MLELMGVTSQTSLGPTLYGFEALGCEIWYGSVPNLFTMTADFAGQKGATMDPETAGHSEDRRSAIFPEMMQSLYVIPSGYVKIAMENGDL